MFDATYNDRSLNTFFYKYLIFLCEWHLKRYERRSEYGQCSHNPEDIVLLEPLHTISEALVGLVDLCTHLKGRTFIKKW